MCASLTVDVLCGSSDSGSTVLPRFQTVSAKALPAASSSSVLAQIASFARRLRQHRLSSLSPCIYVRYSSRRRSAWKRGWSRIGSKSVSRLHPDLACRAWRAARQRSSRSRAWSLLPEQHIVAGDVVKRQRIVGRDRQRARDPFERALPLAEPGERAGAERSSKRHVGMRASARSACSTPMRATRLDSSLRPRSSYICESMTRTAIILGAISLRARIHLRRCLPVARLARSDLGIDDSSASKRLGSSAMARSNSATAS